MKSDDTIILKRSKHSATILFNICFLLGILGIHRFYVGRIITGILMLLTFGGFTIWWLSDLVAIVQGKFEDRHGDIISFATPYSETPAHAGFWIRFAAASIDISIIYSIDLIICIALVVYTGDIDGVLGIKTNPNFMVDGTYEPYKASGQMGYFQILLLILGFFYYVYFQASEKQATPGKRLVYIYVVDNEMKRLSPEKAVLRTLAYVVSYITLGFGFFMIGFTDRKKGLHDYIAGTEVVRGRPFLT